MKKKAVIVYSGGMDSRTVLAKAQWMDRDVYPLSMYYGQKHAKEVAYAQHVCSELNLIHKLVNMEFMKDIASNSSLTSNKDVPEGHYEEESMKDTVVPNRNMILLSIAIAYAVNIGADEVWYGAHAGDHAIYPDCRPEFIDAMKHIAHIANWSPVKIVVPYTDTDKTGILKEGMTMLVDYSMTWTCYNGRDKACGKCGACQERLEAFKQVGLTDPLEYEA